VLHATTISREHTGSIHRNKRGEGWIAIAVFAEGLVSCVLFHAVAAATENTAEIRPMIAGHDDVEANSPS
jgi:hypothetical protein